MQPFFRCFAPILCVALFLHGSNYVISAPATEQPTLFGSAIEALGDSVPDPPPGYKNASEVKTAILTGKLQLVAPYPEIPDDIELVPDIEFAKHDDKSLQLDLYLPRDLKHPVPTLVFIHGGGWKGGSRTDYRVYGVDFAARGYVVASISYRFSAEAHFPAAVHDVKCAVRWLRANAEKYHIDRNQIAAIGGSAGGHLAMMLAYSDTPELTGNCGNSEFSSRVQAVVNLYGPVDLTVENARTESLVRDFLGKSFDESRERYRLASPLTHITADDPPTLIFHGTIDRIVPVQQADLLAEKLKAVGVPYIYDRLGGWPHSLDASRDINDRCQLIMSRFLERYLSRSK